MKIRSRENGVEKIVEIDSLRRVDLKPNEKIVIQVDVGMMPPARAKQFMDEVRDHFKGLFPQNTVIVAPTSFKITVLP